MQNIGIKHIMDIDIFCCIHEGGELVSGDNGVVKYIGGRTICIEIDKHMSYAEFRSRVCGTLNLQSDLVKLEFTAKFDSSFLILLCHAPNPGPTRLAGPNRFPGRETQD